MSYKKIKDILDKILAITGFVFLMPLTIVVFFMDLRKDSRGPIFFKQERIGKDGKTFKILKYRTMKTDAEDSLKEMFQDDACKEEWEHNYKIKEDPRITTVGKVLRKTSLDELPQVVNVLKGDMACIGPRPLVPGELEHYGGDRKYWDVKPGITSWWGCNGRSNTSAAERLRLEYYYIDNLSLKLDAKCFFKTIIAVISRDGAR